MRDYKSFHLAYPLCDKIRIPIQTNTYHCNDILVDKKKRVQST